jgi:hypothetical protein
MLTYNTKIICTYNTLEVFLETDNITNNEKQFIRDAIYRQELLNILGIDEFNEQIVYEKIHELYTMLYDCADFNECIRQTASHFITSRFLATNNEYGLMILFSFDYLHQTHLCISEFLETKKISRENIEELKQLICCKSI